MEPNHITIHSKLKEFFGLQITSKDWGTFVELLSFDLAFQQQANYFGQITDALKVECIDGVFIFFSDALQ